MRSSGKLLFGLALALSPFLVAAQSNLGELLDAGAKRLPTAEFMEQIVQHTIVGPAPAGGSIEVMYAANGTIQGVGTLAAAPQLAIPMATIRGEWTIDERERVCTTMQVSAGLGASGGTILAPRCQAWFKLGDEYFLSDSDSDRGTKVLRRTIKVSPPFVALDNLGELLDAGAKRLSAEEFRRTVAERTIVGPLPTGGTLSAMYAANGSIQGVASPGAYNAPYRADSFEVSGSWTIADDDRVCATMKIRHRESNRTVEDLPQRCQFWFRLGDELFIADSASDRDARVLRWTIRP